MPLKPTYQSTLTILVLVFLLFSCQKAEQENRNAIFKFLSSEITGVDFNNQLTESARANILTYQYFYNGGGVAVGDLNNNGLLDIYFSGNMVPNALYMNEGEMKFKDITASAQVAGKSDAWTTGVSMVDINADGLLDIYVCYSGSLPEAARRNELFINQGVDDEGRPVFTEEAAAYGLDDPAYTTSAVFFDYDGDGDLDVLLVNHNNELFRNLNEAAFKQIQTKVDPEMSIKLMENDGGFFRDVSEQAGLNRSPLTYGLGAGVADINGNGHLDIYIANDYSAPDYLYINQGDGTFRDELKTMMGHTSLYSMGVDIADINNNGLMDIYTLDMLPEDNKRQKLLFSPDNYEHFNLFVRVGLHYQYMRNMLQLNNGDGTFSEVGQLAGVSNTDWSWAPLFADFNNSGRKDLFVSNGFVKDFTNLDFINYRTAAFQNGRANETTILDQISQMPSTLVSNYVFENLDGLSFKDQTRDWGLHRLSNSNGAVYADLDNDGDLDLIVNNLNEPAFIIQNTSSEQELGNFLQIELIGEQDNLHAVGACVKVYHGGEQQVLVQMPYRGYQSSVSPVLHFGLGTYEKIDSLQVNWPDGRISILENCGINQRIQLQLKGAQYRKKNNSSEEKTLVSLVQNIAHRHHDKPYNDFKRQALLVNPLSQIGPVLVKGDVNGDGLEDLFVGGGMEQESAIYLQQKEGRFEKIEVQDFQGSFLQVDAAAVFFDVDRDGDLDLYVVSGGYHQFGADDALLQDRLYLNDGKGNFALSRDNLEIQRDSGGAIGVADLNGDGFLDLFIGGRVVPGRYPESPKSHFFINDGKGKLIDQTEQLAPELSEIGMVTGAEFYDLNGDGEQELILVGEWMPITIFKQKGGVWREVTLDFFPEAQYGLWNTLLVEDLNGDGKAELLAGNMGTNSQLKASKVEPATLVFKDFDANGTVDPILNFYVQGVNHPFVTRDELANQIYGKRTQFPDYSSYASATLEDLFTKSELKDAQYLKVNQLETSLFRMDANHRFHQVKLPKEVQYAPVFVFQTIPNTKGTKDLFLAGNINYSRLRFGKYDANYGVILRDIGDLNFVYMPQTESGFKLKGDVRSTVVLGEQLVIGIHNGLLKTYQINQPIVQPDTYQITKSAAMP